MSVLKHELLSKLFYIKSALMYMVPRYYLANELRTTYFSVSS